jgi:hypothetical protein
MGPFAFQSVQAVHLLIPHHFVGGDIPVPDADGGRAGGDLQRSSLACMAT